MSAATKAILAIDNMEDLREAESALKVRWRELQRRAAISFRVGDKVAFTAKTGKTVTGTITKINQKTVSLRTIDANWKVSPSLLRKV